MKKNNPRNILLYFGLTLLVVFSLFPLGVKAESRGSVKGIMDAFRDYRRGNNSEIIEGEESEAENRSWRDAFKDASDLEELRDEIDSEIERRRGDALERAKSRALQNIDTLIELIEKLKVQINSKSDISAEDKAEFMVIADEAISFLEGKKQEVENAQEIGELQEIFREAQSYWQSKQEDLTIISMGSVVSKLESLLQKIEGVFEEVGGILQELSDEGKDISEAQGHFDSAYDDYLKAKEEILQAIGAIEDAQSGGSTELLKEEVSNYIGNARLLIRSASQKLRSVLKVIRENFVDDLNLERDDSVSVVIDTSNGRCHTNEQFEVNIEQERGVIVFSGVIVGTSTPCDELSASVEVKGNTVEILVENDGHTGPCTTCIGAVDFSGLVFGLEDGSYDVQLIFNGSGGQEMLDNVSVEIGTKEERSLPDFSNAPERFRESPVNESLDSTSEVGN